MDIDNITVDDERTMEQDIAYGINVVQHKYSMVEILKGNHYSLHFVKLVHNPDTAFPPGRKRGK